MNKKMLSLLQIKFFMFKLIAESANFSILLII